MFKPKPLSDYYQTINTHYTYKDIEISQFLSI